MLVQVLSQHPDVDMISFTGSTRAGKMITKARHAGRGASAAHMRTRCARAHASSAPSAVRCVSFTGCVCARLNARLVSALSRYGAPMFGYPPVH